MHVKHLVQHLTQVDNDKRYFFFFLFLRQGPILSLRLQLLLLIGTVIIIGCVSYFLAIASEDLTSSEVSKLFLKGSENK